MLHLFLYFFVDYGFGKNEIFDHITNRKRFSSQNQIKTRYYIVCYFYLVKPYFRLFDLEIDISTLKMKLNYSNNTRRFDIEEDL